MAYNMRKRDNKSLTEKFQDVTLDSDFSESGSEYMGSDSSESSSSSEFEDEEASGSDLQQAQESSSSAMVKKSKNLNQDKIYVIKSDDYFTNSSQKKAIVSNSAFDKLQTPKLQQDVLHKLLKSASSVQHKKHLQALEDSNQGNFARWLYLMHEGFNIVLYGLGSKMNILENFRKKYLTNMPVIVINGFFPSLSIKSILEVILSDVLELSYSCGNVYDACDVIAQELSNYPSMHVYILVHNIEGDMLKNSKAQSVLSKLASVRNIHLVASIDHVSAPLIWDNTKLSKFNFIWYDVTSFQCYINETSFEGSMIVERSKQLALSSLNNVFLSLTSNSKGIYLIIAKYQLENDSGQHYQGFLFKDLYWACRDAFLVSSDLALRSQLTEFVDHKMVKLRRSADGSEFLVIPTAKNILQQFYDDQSK